MQKHFLSKIILAALVMVLAISCDKWSDDNNHISVAYVAPAKPISDSAPLRGAISGTLLNGKTYYADSDIIVNERDSLIIQPGVKLYFRNQSGLIVKGNFFSLGSQSQPIYLGVQGVTKNDAPQKNYKASKDSAFTGLWKGVVGATTCRYMIFKWTHLEYCGATASANNSSAYVIAGLKNTDACYGIYFSNELGYLVFEDSWMYGSVDDAIRIAGNGGKFAIIRSTFEKCGKNGGDVLNIKAGGVGDMAFNMFIGSATNSLKAANSGIAPGIDNCQANVYNNTIINSGYRQTKTGRGGSINYENGAYGKVFNNLIVNCKYGLRLNTNVPDTAYMNNGNYGYNYYWADSLSVANQIFPVTAGAVTKPMKTDFPNPFSYLPTNYRYVPDTVYDGTKAVQVGNPMFTSYPLPVTGGYYLQDITAIGKFNFHLQSNSPCIGVGYTGFSPIQAVPIDAKYGVSNFSFPNADIGCYPFNGTGNLH